MANIHFDGELMHQMVPSMPISGNHGHHAVRDSSEGHMLFSIGDAGELFLLRPDGFNAQYSLLDLRTCLGLDAVTKVIALAVSQDSVRQIYVAFATQGETEKSANSLRVLRPQAPAVFEGLDQKTNIAATVFPGEDTKANSRIEKIFLGDVPDPTTGYPVLVAIYHRLDRNVLDAAHVIVQPSESKWQYNSEFRLPENPSQMIDLTCGSLPTGDFGLFYLYCIQGVTTLSFCSVSTPDIVYGLQVRPEASSLATFVNSDGNTDLIVGGGYEIYHYTAFVCSESRFNDQPPAYKVISSDPLLLNGLQQLSVAQAGASEGESRIAIFARNAMSCVIYQSFDIELRDGDDPDAGKVSFLKAEGKVTPLFTSDDNGGRFVALLEPNTGSQKLFIANGSGSTMTLMEQSSSTKLWQSLTLLVPSTGTNMDVVTFTTHVKLLGPEKQSLALKRVLLKASSPVDLAVNGKITHVTIEGVPVMIDSMSTLTIIHNVDDISTVLITVEDIPGQQEIVLGGSVTFDPSKKAQAKLQRLSSVDKLRDARLPNGEKLLPDNAKNDDIALAASALSSLSTKIDEVSNGKHDDGDPELGLYTDGESSSWGLWHWLSGLGSEIKKWFVSAWEFVIETAEGVYRFVLKTVSHVMKAVTFVFKTVGVAFKKLAEFVAFLFNWDDILDMRTILVKVVNTGIDALGDAMDVFTHAAGDWFDDLDDRIASLDVPETARHQRLDPKSTPESEHSKLMDSPGGNWSNYQLQHGDVGKSLSSQATPTTQPSSSDPFSKTWTDVILPCLQKIGDLFAHLGSNFLALFTNKDLSLGDLLKHMGVDLLKDLVSILKSLVVGLLRFANILIKGLRDAMNANISIPILSALYRKISGGKELTMLDAICLLVAIPTTVLYKAMTGKSPRDSPVFKDLLDGRLDDEIAIPEKPPAEPLMSPADRKVAATNESTRTIAAAPVNVFSLHANSFAIQANSVALPANSLSGPPFTKLNAKAMANPPGKFGDKGRPRDWLLILWDGLCYVVRNFGRIIRVLKELAGIFMPVVNTVIAVLAPAGWIKPDLPGADIPAGEAGNYYSPSTKLWVGLGVLSYVGSFPLDCLNVMLPKSMEFPAKPASGKRFVIWLLSMFNVPALLFCQRKKTLCRIQGLVALLQLPLVACVIYDDVSASGADTMTILSSAERGCTQVTKIAAALASNGNLADPVSQVSGGIAVLFVSGSIASQVGVVAMNFKTGTYREVQSLFGI